jgi:hypothetical protein
VAPKKKSLRSVAEGEKPPPSTVFDAAERGSRLDELKAMRRVIARRLDDDSIGGRDLASLTKRLSDMSKDIEDLEVQEAERLAAEGVDAGYGATDAEWRPTAI